MTLKHIHVIWFFLFVGFFLLGMPLDGTIPDPVRSRTVASNEFSQHYWDAAIWGSFYLVTAVLCTRKRLQLFQVAGSNRALLALVAWLGLSSIWSANTEQAAFMWIQLVGSLAFAAMTVIYFHKRTSQLLRVIALALTSSLIINVCVVSAFPSFSMDEAGRWAGVTGNPNYLGSLAAIAALCSVIAISNSKLFLKSIFFGSAFCLAIYVLFRSDSVTSLVALSAVLIWYLLVQTKIKIGGRPLGKAVFLILFVALATVVYVQLTLDSALEIVGRDRGLSGRLELWKSGIELIFSKPFIGHGLGSDTKSLGVLFRATSFHNGFLELTIKSGLVGILLLSLWLKTAIKALWIGLKNSPYGNMAIGSIFIYSLVYNLAESSFAVARSPAWLALIISAMLLLRNQQLEEGWQWGESAQLNAG